MTQTSGERQEQLLTEFLLLCTDKELAAMAEQIIRYDRYGIPESPLISKWREEGVAEGIEKGHLELLRHPRIPLDQQVEGRRSGRRYREGP
ncbi:hypothetical protein, partial [Candidatus Viridilinea mediisalina]